MKHSLRGIRIVIALRTKVESELCSRVSQYVYVPSKDTYFQTLDQHADTLEGDIKPPLVLLGTGNAS